MANHLIVLVIHIICFAGSLLALTALQFERFCNIRQAWKVQLLIFLMAMGLGYLCAQFILTLTIYNGLMF